MWLLAHATLPDDKDLESQFEKDIQKKIHVMKKYFSNERQPRKPFKKLNKEEEQNVPKIRALRPKAKKR